MDLELLDISGFYQTILHTVCHQAPAVPEQDGLQRAFTRLPAHLPRHPGGGPEVRVRVPLPLLLPSGAAQLAQHSLAKHDDADPRDAAPEDLVTLHDDTHAAGVKITQLFQL